MRQLSRSSLLSAATYAALLAGAALAFLWTSLMNTRGLVELIALNIGLDLHVLSPALFAMLVLMALATTVATTPLLALLQRGAGWEQAAEKAPGAAVSHAGAG